MLNESQERAVRTWSVVYGCTVIGWVLLMAARCSTPVPVHAQDLEAARGPLGTEGAATRQDTAASDLELLLAQAFVAEADFDAANDHAAIAHVLQRRARAQGIPLEQLVRRYVSVFKAAVSGKPRTRWVRGLRADGERPEGWPAHLSWAHWRPKWMATIERAHAFLSGELADPCAGRAQHWGGVMDHHRAERAGWTRINCGPTRNTFFATGDR